VRIFLNPKDYPLVEQLIAKFVDKLSNVKIELIKKDDISRGDFWACPIIPFKGQSYPFPT